MQVTQNILTTSWFFKTCLLMFYVSYFIIFMSHFYVIFSSILNRPCLLL